MTARTAHGQTRVIHVLRRARGCGNFFDMRADALQHVPASAFPQQTLPALPVLHQRIAKRVTLHGGSTAVNPSAEAR